MILMLNFLSTCEYCMAKDTRHIEENLFQFTLQIAQGYLLERKKYLLLFVFMIKTAKIVRILIYILLKHVICVTV